MTSYYIAPYGNDANPGTQVSPRRSLFAARNLCSAGDTVYLLPGVYPYAGLDVGAGNGDENDEWRTVTGTNVNPITIEALVPHTAILDFTGSVFSSETRPGIRLHNTSYLTLRNFRIRNSPGRFINISGTSSNIVLDNILFSRSYEAGLSIGCESATVQNCYLVDSGLLNEDYALEGDPGGGGWPIAFRTSTAVTDGSADNAVWTNNHIARFWGEGGGVGQGLNSVWTKCSFHNNWSVTGIYMNATAGPQAANSCHARITLSRFNKTIIGSSGNQHGFTFATENDADPQIANITMTDCTVDGKPNSALVEDGYNFGFYSAFRWSYYADHVDPYHDLVVTGARVGRGVRFGLSVDEAPVGVDPRPYDNEFVDSIIFQPTPLTYYEIESDAGAWTLTGNTVA